MEIRTKLVRLFGFFCVGVGALTLAGSFLACLVFWTAIGDIGLWKKIFMEILIILGGIFGFLVGIAVFEYLNAFALNKKKNE